MTMRRRDFLRTAAVTAALPAAGTAAAAHGTPPNIVFFFVDDQRDDTLGCAGHPVLKTPVIDGIARRGVRFKNAFVTTSICAASRASVFTGVHERAHGYTFGKPPVPARYTAASYPAILKREGYRTGFIGKYGVNMKGGKKTIFDFFKPLNRNPYFKKQPDGSKRHITELSADRAQEFIESNPADTPFCLSISFNAVHAEDRDKKDHYPWPKAVDGMYEDIDPAPPRLGNPQIFESQPDFLKKSLNRQRYFWRWDTPEKYKKNMRAYFRMISGVDRAIGRVLKALEEKGLADNTVLIYAGDNGYYMGDRGFAGKWSHYEQSLRVPLIIADPRADAGKRGIVSKAMALNIDITATMLDLAGADVPKHYRGRSLLPLLAGRTPSGWREDFFCEHLMNHKAIPKWEGVRGSRYVYAKYFEQSPPHEFLHDLETDPDQFKNFAGDPKYADILAKMRTRCAALKKICDKRLVK